MTTRRSGSATADSNQSAFIDRDRLESADGIVAIISQRKSNGTFTFAVFKEFLRDGKTERTSFISEDMAESYRNMVELAITRVKKLRAEFAASLEREVAG